MQLTDEPDKRCYPLDDHLFCRKCHINELGGMQPNSEVGISVSIERFTWHFSFTNFLDMGMLDLIKILQRLILRLIKEL